MTENVSKDYPEPLKASVKGTFAYYTVKDRLPVTIAKGIDFITRNRGELAKRFGPSVNEDCKNAIEKMSQLRYEMVTDKQLRPLEDDGADLALWNESFEEIKRVLGLENCTWFKAPWIYIECYLYRRIREAMLTCSSTKSPFMQYDPFEQAKIESYELSQKNISALINTLCPLNFADEEQGPNRAEILRNRFQIIVQAQLWANKNDLSLSSGEDVSSKVKNLVGLIESMKSNILCDHIDQLWDYVFQLKQNASVSKRIDVVLDNCAIEFTSDLILCDFLLRNSLVDQVILHAKPYSWFISDVTQFDYDYQFKFLQRDNSLIVNRFISRLNSYKSDSKLVFKHDNYFWTSPYTFDKMQEKAPDLYKDFSDNSSLVFLKGDLNYRKLIGDLNWPFNTPLSVAVRGFLPTSLCAIRTLKADLVANVDTNEETNPNYRLLKQNNPDDTLKWMNTGDYGVIQFVPVAKTQ